MPKRKRPGGTRGGAAGAWTLTEVVELATRHNLVELEVESSGTRIRVVREHPVAGPAAPATLGKAEHPASAEAVSSTLVTVEAPMVGTFYRAPAPDAAPFINEGDVIKDGQVLCIIEAMKLMNEIEARVPGRLAKILVENGQPVEYGQPLFHVEPHR